MIGETIGSYTILSQLGAADRLGEVYLAEHRHLKRKAAVKLLAREIVGRPDLLERFFLEARATSAIDHPGIVQVFDCEVDATGRPYIVMEYLDGETLAATLTRRGALPAATAARLARGMAEALEAAHAKGIVHRDLKPENVFVQAHPPDSVKLVDFGIAKLAGDFRAGQVHQTRNGAMMGTPLYMSPEQCRDSGKIDFRTDLYSLGCVMFEMLTGHPPFTLDALGDLVVAHLTEQPKEARAVNPSVPKALSELTGELLRKDPAQRPANMRAVADRLAAFLGGLTTVPESVPSAKPAPPAAQSKSTLATGLRVAELRGGRDGRRRDRSRRLAPQAGCRLPRRGRAADRRGRPRLPKHPLRSPVNRRPPTSTASGKVLTDGARHQNGRLYLQIAGNGGVSGWFSNAAVRQSFRSTAVVLRHKPPAGPSAAVVPGSTAVAAPGGPSTPAAAAAGPGRPPLRQPRSTRALGPPGRRTNRTPSTRRRTG